MASVEEAVQRADQNSRNQNAGMEDLFGEVVPDESGDVYQSSEGVREWSEKQRLTFEKDTLGLYLTGHPFDEYEREVRNFASNSIANLKSSRSRTTVVGLVIAVRMMKNKRGQTMCFVTLDDRSARIEATLFSDTYEENREAIIKDTIVAVEGVVSLDDYSGTLKLRVSAVHSMVQARERHANRLEIKVDQVQFNNGFLGSLKDTLSPYSPGACKVALRYCRSDVESTIEFGQQWRVSPTDEVLQELGYLLGDKCVRLVY